MKSTLSFIFTIFILIISIDINAADDFEKSISADSSIQYILNQYQKAYNANDFSILYDYTITQQEYDSVVQVLKINKSACLKPEDESYLVSAFYVQFKMVTSSKVKMDSIQFFKSADLSGCGVFMKKIDAKAYFKNKSVEVPISLIFMREMNNRFKLLQQIFNHTTLTGE